MPREEPNRVRPTVTLAPKARRHLVNTAKRTIRSPFSQSSSFALLTPAVQARTWSQFDCVQVTAGCPGVEIEE